MALFDLFAQGREAPQSVYLFEGPSATRNPAQQEGLYFQYWPSTLSDDYQVNYAEHQIPGGSHPLYQWVGGQGRTISFDAIFTAEINDNANDNPATGFFTQKASKIANSLVPSAVYTVDIAAALDRIRSWMMPNYGQGGALGATSPPPILNLVFPGTRLGGGGASASDSIEVILRSAPITYESWYPTGRPRLATVSLTFSEVVQTTGGGEVKVIFKSRRDRDASASKYNWRGLADRPFSFF